VSVTAEYERAEAYLIENGFKLAKTRPPIGGSLETALIECEKLLKHARNAGQGASWDGRKAALAGCNAHEVGSFLPAYQTNDARNSYKQAVYIYMYKDIESLRRCSAVPRGLSCCRSDVPQ